MFALKSAVRNVLAPGSRFVSTSRPIFADVEKTIKKIAESTDPVDAETGVTGRIPDPHEQATGLEREELLELAKGNTDPFGLEGLKWGPAGTKEAPRKIPSHFDSRVVGCCCDPESELVKYFHVKSGPAQPCPCAQQWFELEKVEGKVTW